MNQGNQLKFLVTKFVKPEKINWPREMKLAKKVLSKYDFEDLEKVSLSFFVNSLAFFLTPDGEDQLRKEFKNIVQEVNIYEDPEFTGEKYEAKYKEKQETLEDFLGL